MNNFVAYLNTLNNANSSNENALAEAQITNNYYKKFHVERNLGFYLAEKLKEKPTCVILTGHAGDGKTSLVYQILKSLKMIEEGSSLKKHEQKYSIELERDLLYIKDMSELMEEKQLELLRKAIKGKKDGVSSIVVSNTGPLINTFRQLIKIGHIKNVSEDIAEMKLLEVMDKNSGVEITVGDSEILLINMARIDNVVLVPKLIDRISSDELWEGCTNCQKVDACPIYNNYKSIKDNKTNVNSFVTSYYRWLFELDRRLTVRQILAQLSYSMTGNLTCNDVSESSSSEMKFRYHFSNLFFGYKGLEVNEEARQIRAIEELQELNLDSKETKYDYDFFVKNDFTHLTDSTKEVAFEIWDKRSQKYRLKPVDFMQTDEPYQLRKAIRRMNFLFGRFNEETTNYLLDQLFSPVFSNYISYRSKKVTVKEKRNVKATIYKALNFILVGTHLEKDMGKIYLPLQRHGTGNQNVQLLLGELNDNDINVDQEYLGSIYDDDESHYEINLIFSSGKKFKIPLMLFDYFNRISLGAVTTSINPSLSHGIDTMKSQLFNDYKYRDENEIIRLLIHTLNGPKLIKLQIDQLELFVD
ncbi:hypothetical protein [Bacillus sp. SJS]|uniref:hypothetical protein n=1 Tax=Bacillus sp. SJS TaxID=1423321 RepID=UPI0004DD8688|nr:hypothetical protein [Bacillus sp. SJS]KZZ84375.1 hypothetical protein AS29_010975 [Bacillus sp. SJS]